uniref:Uncharacterized protein n=1 Tax=Romanomermis culicivorax TaxID=13658 RepID=A0A915KF81_ROMCU
MEKCTFQDHQLGSVIKNDDQLCLVHAVYFMVGEQMQLNFTINVKVSRNNRWPLVKVGAWVYIKFSTMAILLGRAA